MDYSQDVRTGARSRRVAELSAEPRAQGNSGAALISPWLFRALALLQQMKHGRLERNDLSVSKHQGNYV